MPERDTSLSFSTTANYNRYQSDVLQLKRRLAEVEVGDIVSEVLSRVTHLKLVNSDRINQPSRHRVEQLCYALISDEADEGALFIEGLQDDGARLDVIYLCYLAEAAVILGEWWEDDHVNFHEVTIASSRIYAIMRDLGHLFVPQRPVEMKSAVFATVPDETHILGVQMAADLFGAEGWNIDVLSGFSHEELVARIADSTCRILGISAGGEHSLAALTRLIIAVRLIRPDMRILLSGQITQTSNDLIALLDVDSVASSVEDAQSTLNQMWSDLRTPPSRPTSQGNKPNDGAAKK